MTRETYLADQIDRKRAKAAVSVRTLQVRDIARMAINKVVMDMPEEDRAEFMNAAVRHLRTLYGTSEGQEAAVSLFGSMAWSPELQTRAVVARARGEQELAKLMRAANDRGEG